MDVRPGDTLVMKKTHPCGGKEFLVLRSGMDFKIRCTTCGHEVMVPRLKCEKNIRQDPAGRRGDSSVASLYTIKSRIVLQRKAGYKKNV